LRFWGCRAGLGTANDCLFQKRRRFPSPGKGRPGGCCEVPRGGRRSGPPVLDFAADGLGGGTLYFTQRGEDQIGAGPDFLSQRRLFLDALVRNEGGGPSIFSTFFPRGGIAVTRGFWGPKGAPGAATTTNDGFPDLYVANSRRTPELLFGTPGDGDHSHGCGERVGGRNRGGPPGGGPSVILDTNKSCMTGGGHIPPENSPRCLRRHFTGRGERFVCFHAAAVRGTDGNAAIMRSSPNRRKGRAHAMCLSAADGGGLLPGTVNGRARLRFSGRRKRACLGNRGRRVRFDISGKSVCCRNETGRGPPPPPRGFSFKKYHGPLPLRTARPRLGKDNGRRDTGERFSGLGLTMIGGPGRPVMGGGRGAMPKQ